MRSCDYESSLRGSGDSHNEAIYSLSFLSVAKNPKNQSKIFGYFAYAQYDNEKIKKNGLPRLAFASLAMTNQPILSLRGDLSPKQTKKNNKLKKE